MNIFNNISLGVASVGTIVASWFGYAPIKEPINFGASTQSSEVRALFTTTLATKITSSATSMTLSSATDKDGTTLASSTYGFIIDEGTSKEELVLADCTGTTCTNMTRGLSVRTGTTTVAALQFEHGRGAEVKITDAPSLIYASNVFRGKQNLDYKLRYNTAQTFSDPTDIISKDYADSLSFGAIPAASESASGFVELSTGAETASSTSLGGTGARLAIPASLATSTYNSATAGLKVVVTQNNGKIDGNFISNLSGITLSNVTLSGTTTVATTTTSGGSNIASSSIVVFTSDGTWTKKSNLRYVIVELVGGGGSGVAGVSAGSSSRGGAGGGAGGYAKKILLSSQLGSTETVDVGAASASSSFGSLLSATAGSSGSGTTGGGGGSGSGGDINITGGAGGQSGPISSAQASGAPGGSSVLGGGGAGGTAGSGNGGSGGNYGGGGGGGGGADGATGTYGAGAPGVVIVTEYYY